MITTLLSIAGSAIVAYLIARWQMKKNQITHFSINSYDIGKGLSDEFPNFSIHCGEENFVNNVKVLKGGFMNVGNNDITSLNGKSDIKLILPPKCTVKAINVLPSNSGLQVNANKDENEHNVINFGVCSDVLKCDEYFEYTAIIETDDDIENLPDRLNFQHRILNTTQIQNTYIGPIERYRKLRKIKYILCGLLMLLVLSGVYSIMFQKAQFKISQDATNEEYYLYINPYSKLYITNNKIAPFINSSAIAIDDLKSNYSILPETTFHWYSYIIIEVILTLIYVVYIYYSIWGKNRHIINVIRDNEKKSRSDKKG